MATELFFIYSGEHGAFWRPRGAGYTHTRLEAGRYTRTEAERISRGCGTEKRIELVPVPPADLDDIDTLRRKARAFDLMAEAEGMSTPEAFAFAENHPARRSA
jgi:hypothetical protein